MKIKKNLPQIISTIIVAFLFFSAFNQVQAQRPVFDPDAWLIAITPFAGMVKNNTDLQFRTVQYNNPGISMLRGNKSVSGSGHGGGYQIQAVKHGWSITHLSFAFPTYDNHDKVDLINAFQKVTTAVTGTVFGLNYQFQNEGKIKPFVGLLYFQGIGPHDSTVVDRLIFKNETGSGVAAIDRVSVDVSVVDPIVQAGLQFKLPIQNWTFSIYHGYGMERTITTIDASMGRVLGEDLNSLMDSYTRYGELTNPGMLVPTRMQITRNYHSHRPGVSLYMDYRRFISLRLMARRDLNFNRWVTNGIFTLLVHRYGGISIAGEYSERSVATIRYLTIGPTFVVQF